MPELGFVNRCSHVPTSWIRLFSHLLRVLSETYLCPNLVGRNTQFSIWGSICGPKALGQNLVLCCARLCHVSGLHNTCRIACLGEAEIHLQCVSVWVAQSVAIEHRESQNWTIGDMDVIGKRSAEPSQDTAETKRSRNVQDQDFVAMVT